MAIVALCDAADVPDAIASRCARWKFLWRDWLLFHTARRVPALARWFLDFMARRELGAGHALDPDFRPRYEPWSQRVCVIMDGDLFAGDEVWGAASAKAA